MSLTEFDLHPIILSLQLASLTVVILLILGLPLAWWLTFSRMRYKVVIESLVALPLVLPPTVLGFYLLIMLGSNGWLGGLWQQWSGHSLVFSFEGLLIASCLYSLPFVVQPLQAAFSGLNLQTVEASWTLGASHMKTFYRVVLPQIRQGLLSAVVLGFAHTIGEFGVVLMVGGNISGETQVISTAFYNHVEALEYEAAHLYSFILLLFSFLVLSVVYSYNRRWHLELRR